MKKINYAITRIPAESIIYGMSSKPHLGTPIYNEIIKSHTHYVQTLKRLDLKVHQIPKNELFPDSCFVEDVAILTRKCAIIANPGSPNRNSEKTEMAANVSRYYPLDKIHYIQYPGTLDGGDVLMIDDVFFVGSSQRTNTEGINQLSGILKQYGFSVIPVAVTSGLYLKHNVNYLENNNLLVTNEYYYNPIFDQYNKILVPSQEENAVSSIWINGTIIIPLNCPNTQYMIESLNQYNVINCDVAEFNKIDGGISSLSIRF